MIWYDRRCAGLSRHEAEPFALADLASDAVDLLNYLGIERAAVVATSAGGPIGLRLALDHSERVESLVLLNTGASLMSLSPSGVDPADPFVADRLATVAKRLALLDLLDARGIEAVIAESEEEWRSPPLPPEFDPVLASFREHRQRALANLPTSELTRLAHGALLNMRAQRDVDMTDELNGIGCPTLIVHGDADATVPIAFGDALASSMPGADVVRLGGAGHGLIMNPEAQETVTTWLRHFV